MLMVLSHFEEGGTNLTRHPQLLDLVRHNRWLEDSKLIGSRSLIVLKNTSHHYKCLSLHLHRRRSLLPLASKEHLTIRRTFL